MIEIIHEVNNSPSEIENISCLVQDNKQIKYITQLTHN